MTTTVSGYSRVAIGLHWVIGLLLIGNLVGGLARESFGEAAEPIIMGLHKSTGITILVLSLVRLAWRLGHKPPPLAATLKRWEVRLAHATHWIFYFMMFALPLTGWLLVSAGSRKWPINWYGLFDIPYLPIEQAKATAHVFNERHEVLAFAMIALIALHIAAAIKHHVFDRDNTVERMLPWVRSRG